MTALECYSCGAAMVSAILTEYPQTVEGETVIFRDVPCEECPRCGTKYFTSDVMDQMDAALDGRGAAAETIEVTVYSLRPAA